MAEYKNEEPDFIFFRSDYWWKSEVWVGGRIRLLGIDTPESRTKDLAEKFYGKLSSAALKSWLHWAIVSDRNDIEVQVRCPEADSRGKFGRILGELWINCTADGEEFSGWTNLNKWMCEAGYAVGYYGRTYEK
jgi:micrococcal nuclease